MNFIFDNFQILLLIGLAAAAWMKKRAEMKEEEEEAERRRAREEIIRGLQDVERPPTVTRTASGRSLAERRPLERTPPPLRELAPPPLAWPEEDSIPEPEEDPWKRPEGPKPARQAREARQAQPAAAAHFADEEHEGILQRQQAMQDRLAEIKRSVKAVKHEVGGAKATQRRLESKNRKHEVIAPLGNLRSDLRDARQVKRAVVLREILGPPVGMR